MSVQLKSKSIILLFKYYFCQAFDINNALFVHETYVQWNIFDGLPFESTGMLILVPLKQSFMVTHVSVIKIFMKTSLMSLRDAHFQAFRSVKLQKFFRSVPTKVWRLVSLNPQC